MNNAKISTILGAVLLIEVALGLFFLIISGNWATLVLITLIMGGLAGLGYFLGTLGVWAVSNTNATAWSANVPDNKQWAWSGTVGRGRRFNLQINTGSGPERTEVVQQTLSLDASITSFTVEVGIGTLRVTGNPDVKEIQLTATKRVYVNDEYAARTELEKLQVRSWQEGSVLRLYAGPGDGLHGSTFTIGRSNRVDVELVVPVGLTASYNTTSGDLTLQDLKGQITAHTGTGTLLALRVNGGRNLVLNTDAGKVVVQEVAVALLQARTAAGALELTGVGAERLDLASSAGHVRARGVNCGAYKAHTNAGNVELFDGNIDGSLEMHTSLGQVTVENSRAAALLLKSNSGNVNYRGFAPTQDSQLSTNMGAVNLAFAPGAAFNLDARSNLGSVAVYLAPTFVSAQTQNHFAGQIGQGGPKLRVVSQLGSVKIS